MKINSASIVALAALLAVSKAADVPENTPNLRREVPNDETEDSDDALNATEEAEDKTNARARELQDVYFSFNRIDCNKKMVDVEVCFKTDDYPHETIVEIEDEDGEVGFEMKGFTRKGQMYCDDDQFCPGKYWLYVRDSYGDGTSHSYSEIIVRTRKGKLLDQTLYNFGSQYGPRKFVVKEDDNGSRNTNTRTNTRTNTNTNGRCSGPFGSCNCRECKDECADRNQGDSWGKKRCKTDICRAYYGKSVCKD